jgi:hypothetical protein
VKNKGLKELFLLSIMTNTDTKIGSDSPLYKNASFSSPYVWENSKRTDLYDVGLDSGLPNLSHADKLITQLLKDTGVVLPDPTDYWVMAGPRPPRSRTFDDSANPCLEGSIINYFRRLKNAVMKVENLVLDVLLIASPD